MDATQLSGAQRRLDDYDQILNLHESFEAACILAEECRGRDKLLKVLAKTLYRELGLKPSVKHLIDEVKKVVEPRFPSPDLWPNIVGGKIFPSRQEGLEAHGLEKDIPV
jgi:hypothetical protein